MSESPVSIALGTNKILAALPRPQYELFFSKLDRVPLHQGRVLFEEADNLASVYFITRGVISLLSTTESGLTTQIALIGNEGAVGIPTILGVREAPYQATVVISGRAWRVGTDLFLSELMRGGALYDRSLRYLHTLLSQISHSAACNRFHTVEQRLCRLLLSCLDCIDSTRLPLKQETLSRMVGAARPNLSQSAARLRREGIIKCRHAMIEIVDRQRLEEKACKCYRLISTERGDFRVA